MGNDRSRFNLRDFDLEPEFGKRFLKDLGIALNECEQMGISLPGLELASQLYRTLQDLGHGQSGTQALIHAIRKIQVY